MIKAINLIHDLLEERRQKRIMRSLGIRRVNVSMLETQISNQPEREPDDYSFMFEGF